MKIALYLFLFFTFTSLASGKITYLDVSNNTAVFSTTSEKTHALPSCVAGNLQDKWAIALDTDTGKASYALLMTALAADKAIAIESAQDCADADGYERPARIISQTASEDASETNANGNIGIYRHDGSFVGKLVNILDDGSWQYVDASGSRLPEVITYTSNLEESSVFYFTGPSCTGTPAVQATLDPGRYTYHRMYEEAKIFRASHTVTQGYLYELTNEGLCRNRGFNGGVRLLDNNPPQSVCGTHPCILK